MTCMICRNPILKNEAKACEVTKWEAGKRSFRRTMTGRKAHIACLEGKRYDEQQMTIEDMIVDKEE